MAPPGCPPLGRSEASAGEPWLRGTRRVVGTHARGGAATRAAEQVVERVKIRGGPAGSVPLVPHPKDSAPGHVQAFTPTTYPQTSLLPIEPPIVTAPALQHGLSVRYYQPDNLGATGRTGTCGPAPRGQRTRDAKCGLHAHRNTQATASHSWHGICIALVVAPGRVDPFRRPHTAVIMWIQTYP
jgi:hypothetical protein